MHVDVRLECLKLYTSDRVQLQWWLASCADRRWGCTCIMLCVFARLHQLYRSSYVLVVRKCKFVFSTHEQVCERLVSVLQLNVGVSGTVSTWCSFSAVICPYSLNYDEVDQSCGLILLKCITIFKNAVFVTVWMFVLLAFSSFLWGLNMVTWYKLFWCCAGLLHQDLNFNNDCCIRDRCFRLYNQQHFSLFITYHFLLILQ